MEPNINYTNFQPDWWDLAGAEAIAVQARIREIIRESFGPTGPGGVPANIRQAFEDSAVKQAQAQAAMKAAANAAQRAAEYADVPTEVACELDGRVERVGRSLTRFRWLVYGAVVLAVLVGVITTLVR